MVMFKKKKWLTKVVTQFNLQLHCCSKQTESTRNNRLCPGYNLTEQGGRPGSYPLQVFILRKTVGASTDLLQNLKANTP